jgi:hypothetical protein
MGASNSDPGPVSPETQLLIARARRGFIVSIGILVVGLIAVGAGIVYKSSEAGAPVASPAADYALGAIKVPAGATVISAVAAGGLVTVTFRDGDATRIRIIDGRTGELIRDVPVTGE